MPMLHALFLIQLKTLLLSYIIFDILLSLFITLNKRFTRCSCTSVLIDILKGHIEHKLITKIDYILFLDDSS